MLQRVFILEHQRNESSREQVGSFDVDFPNIPPSVRVTSNDGSHVNDTRIINQNIQSTSSSLDLRRSTGHRLDIRHFKVDFYDCRCRSACIFGGLQNDRFARVETGAGGEDDGRGARFGEAEGGGAADASARAADEDDFAGEVLFGWVDGWVGVVVDCFGDCEVACDEVRMKLMMEIQCASSTHLVLQWGCAFL